MSPDDTAAGASREMPRYKSHKSVWALKIADITYDGKGGAKVTPADAGYGPFTIDATYINKHAPQIGGYYVVYADGYKSFSPAKAFEEGYTAEQPSGTKLDAKFYGTIYKAKDGSVVPDDQYVVFLAKDEAFLQTLRFYREECQRLCADAEHLSAVDRMISRLLSWRANNHRLLKVPDAKGEKLLDQCQATNTYRSKPTLIQAWQYNGNPKTPGVCTCGGAPLPHLHTMHDSQLIELEIGDWIVPEPAPNRFYPIKSTVFATKYEAVR